MSWQGLPDLVFNVLKAAQASTNDIERCVQAGPLTHLPQHFPCRPQSFWNTAWSQYGLQPANQGRRVCKSLWPSLCAETGGVGGCRKQGPLGSVCLPLHALQVSPWRVARGALTRRYERLAQVPEPGDNSMDKRMMQFQREGVQFALRKGGRVLIGEQAGPTAHGHRGGMRDSVSFLCLRQPVVAPLSWFVPLASHTSIPIPSCRA